MKLSLESEYIVGIILFTVILLCSAVFFFSKSETEYNREDFLNNDTAIKGLKDAPLYLVEFSDFQCPACKAYKPIVDAILQKYGDKLIFGYRHFPLPQHTFSTKASLAAEAAAEQGKFWEMYEYLFSNQQNFSDEFIQNSGKAIELDEIKFQSSLLDSKNKDKILNDLSEGKRFGVNSTPTFFLNGEKIILKTPSDLETAVEQAIKNL